MAFDYNLSELFSDILKIIVAIVLAAIIGLERKRSGQPVGIRTFSLVCLSSTVLTMVSMKDFGVEAARVIQGIITGIGFLGAGAIMAHGKNVKGHATAAALWAMSIVGTSVGLGHYSLALIVTGLVYIVLTEKKILKLENAKLRKG